MQERHGSNSPCISISLLTAFRFLCYPSNSQNCRRIDTIFLREFMQNAPSRSRLQTQSLSRLKKWIKNLWAGGQRIMLPLSAVIRQHSTLTHAAVARDASARSPCGPRAPPSPEISEQVKSRYVFLSGGARWRPRWSRMATPSCPAISFLPCHRHPRGTPKPIPSQET